MIMVCCWNLVFVVSESPDLVLDIKGVVGHCATAKQCLNVQNATAHPLFDSELDQRSDHYRYTSL